MSIRSEISESASAVVEVATSPTDLSRGAYGKFAVTCTLLCVLVGAMMGYDSLNTDISGSEGGVHKERIISSVADPSTTNKQRMSGMERLLKSELEPQDARATKEEVLLEKVAKKTATRGPSLFW
jgi:hypothetical protein